jgi:hypothetical protein
MYNERFLFGATNAVKCRFIYNNKLLQPVGAGEARVYPYLQYRLGEEARRKR